MKDLGLLQRVAGWWCVTGGHGSVGCGPHNPFDLGVVRNSGWFSPCWTVFDI